MIQEKDNPFQTIFESAVEGVIVSDSKGKILMANPAAEKHSPSETDGVAGAATGVANYVFVSSVDLFSDWIGELTIVGCGRACNRYSVASNGHCWVTHTA